MTMKQKRMILILSSVLAIVIIVSVGSLLAVHLSSKEQKATTSDSTTLVSEEKPEKEGDLNKAKKLYEGYYYTEAKEELKNQETEEAKNLLNSINKSMESLVKWDDPSKISHLFFHSLIKDSQKAFKSKEQAQGYRDYMVTIPEFNHIIEQLYVNDYVLIDLEKLISKDEKNHLHFEGVKLPKNKKPLILSQDDVSYYEYMKGDGFADKLMIDQSGDIKNTYSDDGEEEIGDYDMIPLLDQFVKEHPDFSYQGAKGIIALTGYNGVLGYRTSESEYGKNKKTDKEITKAKEVAKALKEDGWTFASHSWGHINMTDSSLAEIKKDNELWQQEVAPIIGETNVLIYPFGADINDWLPYQEQDDKFDYLKEQGFDIFCNVDASQHAWGQFDELYYRNARINVDGIRFESELKNENNVLEDFFDTKTVYDTQARG